MRATLCLLTLLALQLVGPRTASAQIPMPTTCTIFCSDDSPHAGAEVCSHPCDQNGTELRQCVECSCYDRCGGESSTAAAPSGSGTDSSGADTNQKGDAIDALANLVALLFIPGVFRDFRRDPATVSAEIARAEADWENFRNRRKELEDAGRGHSERQRERRQRAAQLDRELREAAASKRKEGVPEKYRRIPPEPDKKQRDAKRWGPHGYCRGVLEDNDAFLSQAKELADDASLNAMPIPKVSAVAGRAKKAIRDGALATAGPPILKAQGEELSKMSDELEEYLAFIAALETCLDEPGWYNCTLALLDTAPGALKAKWAQVIGKGRAGALERARSFASVFKRYVNNVQTQVQKRILAASRCP